MKNTKNRNLILAALSESYETPPPHSAYTVFYILETAFKYKWKDHPYSTMKTAPNIQQIHRTLKDLWHGGVIVGTRVKEKERKGHLPYWVVHYQLSEDVYKNWLIKECRDAYNKAERAKFGVDLFGIVFDRGLPEKEAMLLAKKVRLLMQKTHPDKEAGFEAEFKKIKEAHDWIKSGIPLPTPAYSNTEKILANPTYLT